MQAPVELVPLRCLRCDTPVPAEPDEVAWLCAQCGQGLLLDEAKGLAALEIQTAAGIPPGALGRPFWVASGQVRLQRETHEGFIGRRTGQAERFWAEPRRFFVPEGSTGPSLFPYPTSREGSRYSRCTPRRARLTLT